MFPLLLAVALAGQPSKRPSDAERGKQLYQRHCVQCHGVRNRGDGPATPALLFETPNLEGKTETKGEHVTSVLNGKNAMPGFVAVFNEADAVRVLKFMASLGSKRSLKPPAVQPPPGKPDADGPEADDLDARPDD